MTIIQITKNQLEELINLHALKASSSHYDAGVCIAAIATLRDQLMPLVADQGSAVPLDKVIGVVGDLAQEYSDPDGQYTSGRSSIIGLLDDLYCLKFEQEESPDSNAS